MHSVVRSAKLAVFATTLCLSAGPATASNGAMGLDWQSPVSVATGDAHRGPWRMNDSDFDFVDDPTVALLPDDDAGVAWVDHTRKDVLFQRFGPNGGTVFDTPVNVSESPDIFSWLPRIAVAPNKSDTLYVLWQEIVFSGGTHGGEIFFARSTDGGASFSEPLNLSQTRAGAGKGRLSPEYWHNGSLDIAVAPGGTIYAVWTEYEGPLRLARSTDGGKSFSEPRRIAGGPEQPARGPALAAGSDGRLHVAWTVGGDPAADIRYASATDGGRSFSEVRLVDAGKGHADAPKLILDHAGTLHLAYAVSRTGPLQYYDVRYTHKRPDTDGFEPPRTISTPLPDGYAGAAFPHLAAAGKRLYAAFELFPDTARQRPTALALACSADGGDRFTSPAVVPGTAAAGTGINGSQQGLLMEKLAAGSDGAVTLANSKFKQDEFSRVRLYRVQSPSEGC